MEPTILNTDFIKLMRPYLYNTIYNRTDAMCTMLNYCRELDVCNGEPYFTYYPFSLHIPLNDEAVSNDKIVNGMLYRVLVQFEAVVLEDIRQLTCGYGDTKEMYRFLLANLEYLYTHCKIRTESGSTVAIVYL